MSVQIYDPSAVKVLISGIPISGYANGTFVSLEHDADSYTKIVGVRGEVGRVRNPNRAATLTLTLDQSSNWNLFLSAFTIADDFSDSVVFPVAILDFESGLIPDVSSEALSKVLKALDLTATKVIAGLGWIRRKPAIRYGTELQDREWIIDIANVEIEVLSGQQIQNALE